MTTGNQYSPSVTTFSNGDALIAWDGNQTGDYDIYGRILTADYLNSLISVPPVAPIVPPVTPPVSPPPPPPPSPPVAAPVPLPQVVPPSALRVTFTGVPSVPPIEPPVSGTPPVSEPTPTVTQEAPESGTPTGTYVGAGLATLGAIGLCAGGTWCVVDHKKKKNKNSESQNRGTVMTEVSSSAPPQEARGNYGTLPDQNAKKDKGYVQIKDN